MDFTPITVEEGCTSFSIIERFVHQVGSEVMQRKQWLKYPELCRTGYEWKSWRGKRHEFIVFYKSLEKDEACKPREYKIVITVSEYPEGLEGLYTAYALSQGLKVSSECYAILNNSGSLQSINVRLDSKEGLPPYD